MVAPAAIQVQQAPAQALQPARLNDWPAELCIVSASSVEALSTKLHTLAARLAAHPSWPLPEVAKALLRDDRAEAHRMSIVAKDTAGLAKSLKQALARLAEPAKGGGSGAWSTRTGVSYGAQRVEGKLAFLFPGEGSQYPDMFSDLAPCFDTIQGWLDFWHGLYDLPVGHTRTDIVFPSSDIGAEQRKALEHRMHDMDVGSESVFIGGMAMHELLIGLGVQPDVMMGHSSGESAALGASGANPALTPEERAACISRHFAAYETLLNNGQISTGALLAVGALPPATVEEQIAAVGQDVVVAMDNCANQMVLYGSPQGIAAVQSALTSMGGICLPLPFDRGYHTPAFAAVSKAFLQYYKDVKLGPPKVPLYSCASVGLFPDKPAAVRQLAAAQWSQKVRFRETVLKMHDDGVRLFVEVGPSANLTAFVNDILIDRDYVALATNVRRKGGVEQLLGVLGQLYIAGHPPALDRLFAGRRIADLDLSADLAKPGGVLLDNTMPMVRLDAADRDALRELFAASLPASVSLSAPTSAPDPAADAAPPSERPVESASVSAPAEPQPVADDAPARVMAEYFDVMRGFLAQQTEVVSRWPLANDLPMDAHAASGPTPAWPSTHGGDSPTPLLDEIVHHDATSLHARCRVSLLNDRFIRDHVMSGPVSATDPTLFGLSCVPFTVSLEVMAEACGLLAGRYDVRVIQNVKAFDWITLDEGELSFDVHAHVIDAAQGRYGAHVVTARGTALSAEFVLAAEWRLPPVADLVDPRESCLNSPNLYATGMFHGPVFQSMHYVQAWDDTGIDVELTGCTLDGFFAEGQRPRLVLNPVLLDAMGQVVACWLVQYVGTQFHSFPSTIDRLELYESSPADREGIVLRMRQRPADGVSTDIMARRVWQFDCVDGEGRVLMRGHDLVNLFFTVPPAYHDFRCDPLGAWLGAPSGLALAPEVQLWDVPLMSEEFCAQSGAICLRIMAHALLGAAERGEW